MIITKDKILLSFFMLKYNSLRAVLLLVFCFSYLLSISQDLSLEIDNIYDFSPHQISKKEQEKKVKPMDDFWNKIKSDTLKYLPQLRRELMVDGHKSFFYFDGSALLLYVSNIRSDKSLAADAISKCDLNDIDRKIYVNTLNRLAFDTINVVKGALKILSDTGFRFFVVEHVLFFNQDNCLAYCLLPMTSNLYTGTLIDLFKSQNATSQQSILYTLWLGYTCRGDSLIKVSANDMSFPKEVRKMADDLLSQNTGSSEIKKVVDSMSNQEALELRIHSLKRFSDEALSDLYLSTLALRIKNKCEMSTDNP